MQASAIQHPQHKSRENDKTFCAVFAAEFDQTQPTCRLDDLLPLADLVICAMPLTAETAGLFDSERIAKIKPGTVFVNVARGKVTDQQALVEALRPIVDEILDVRET